MRNNFRDFILSEASREKTIVFSFGRFQPPTIGHQLLVNKVVEFAKKHKSDHRIYASKTQDKKSNPLDVETKIHFLKKMFPGVNFEAANETVRTFIEALKQLYREGYQHVYMVAGSDRLMEYQKLFDRYNGGEEFNFKTLLAISAGERDPDAEGAAGMSGTKMRNAATQGDFSLFRTGVPKSLSDKDAKELMEKIKKSMVIKEFVEFVTEDAQELNEGINDKSLLKVIFLAGGPGSGKDYVMKNTLNGLGLVEINSDNAFEYLLDKYDFDKKMSDDESAQRELLRKTAKTATELRERFAIQGRNGLIINGTGDNPKNIKKLVDMFQGLGYDTPQMIMVNTRDEVSYARNKLRGERGGRTVPENIRKQKWDSVQSAIPKYKEMFGGDNFHEFDNSEDLKGDNANPDLLSLKANEIEYLSNKFRKYTEAAVDNEIANSWKETQKSMARRVAGQSPQPDTRASIATPKLPTDDGSKLVDKSIMDKAKSMGLTYLKFGRFGKNGKVTHKEVQGKLVAIKESTAPLFKAHKSPAEIAHNHRVPLLFIMKQLKKGIKVEHEHTNSEKLARIIALQHLDEIPSYYIRLKKAERTTLYRDEAFTLIRPDLSKNLIQTTNESHEFSSTDAFKLLTLGKFEVNEVPKKKSKKDLIELFGKMLELLSKEDLTETIAKENVGETNSMVKREDFSNFLVERYISAGRKNSRSSSKAAAHSNSLAENQKTNCSPRKKIDKLQEKSGKLESYDSPSVESPGVFGFSKDDITKRGKASVTELTGDESTASISSQIEDGLKKSGINIASFKSKNPI